jgi:hypothetical protein
MTSTTRQYDYMHRVNIKKSKKILHKHFFNLLLLSKLLSGITNAGTGTKPPKVTIAVAGIAGRAGGDKLSGESKFL